MRLPIMAANWKMQKTPQEAEHFVAQLPSEPALYGAVDVVICPPFTVLSALSQALQGTGIKLGAQNMHPAKQGAFTGEISPLMLKDLGCTFVILGHSERRHLFGESDAFINEKVKAALAHGLLPILCVGETLEQRQKGDTEAVCRQQLTGALAGVEAAQMAQMVIAYEPVWAIGTGVNASAADAEGTIAFIRRVLSETYGQETAQSVRIQYGGSVKPENAQEYLAQENIDGALVGGASLEADSFVRIIKAALC